MQQKMIETGVKMSLRLSFKLASGLALPFPILRGAMEVGSRIFKPRADVAIQQIKLRDARDIIALSWWCFFCRFITNPSSTCYRIGCTSQGQRVYAGLSTCA